MTKDTISQVAIFCLGVVAVWLSQSPVKEAASYACLFGLMSQPFWLRATYKARQWGMFALSLIYVVAWIRGVNTYWLGWF